MAVSFYWGCLHFIPNTKMHFFIERALFTLLLVVVRTIVEKVLLLKILSKNASPPHNLGFCKPCLYPFLGHPSRDQYITSKYYKNKIPFETKNCKFRFTPFLNNENAFYPCIIHPSWCRDPFPGFIFLGINILPQKIIKIKYHLKPKIINLDLLLF